MNRSTSFLLALAAAVAGLALVGYAVPCPILYSWLPSAVTMKQLTALMIIEHATATYLLCLPGDRRHFRQPLLVIAALSFLLVPGVIHKINRLENLASFDPRSSFFPSVITILASTLLATRIVVALYCRWQKVVRVLGMLTALIGAAPLVGYLFGCPKLYYFIPGYTTAMAVPTAIGFLALGLATPPPAVTIHAVQ